MAFTYVRDEDIKREYQNGVCEVEVLPGNFKGHHHYKVYLKAGTTYVPTQTYTDKTVLYIFGAGKGYVATEENSYNINNELCFYVADLDNGKYAIHAVTDMEFMHLVVDMNEYIQDCKGPTTESWSVLPGKIVGRVSLGVCRAVGREGVDEGTIEKGHTGVHQWNYCLGDSDFRLKVQGSDEIICHSGDWSFIPAGLDHSMIPSAPGKELFYVWFEQYTRKTDPTQFIEPTEEELNDY